MFVTAGHIKPRARTRHFGTDTLANAIFMDVIRLHGPIIIINLPIDAITVHFSKYEASIIR